MAQNLVVVLLDSLNRHHLGCYGGSEFDTPNIDRFARERATRFTRHVTGSLPCMPARHDILCGALDFLWRPWGSIELWERPITADLRDAGVTTMLVTDHPHLFETGGENYHTDFGGWDYVRGHEGDPWRTWLDPSWIGVPTPPAAKGDWFLRRRMGDNAPHLHRAYDTTRTWFREETDYPGPRTMSAAADWLDLAARQPDRDAGRWMLFIDEFDPHEPFDTPEPWRGRYEDEPWEGEQLIWPPYVVGGRSSGLIDEHEARHVRANYGSKLSMIDHWFGRVLDTFDRHGLWDDTALVVCTDHGHYLGEERDGVDIWGKPMVPQFEPLGHTPLLIHWPGVAGGSTCDALTTSVDLHATIADQFGVVPPHRTHGRSILPLLNGHTTSIRDWAVGGVFGNWVQVTDGEWKYARAPEGDNFPLSMWSNRWSTMPVHVAGMRELPPPDERAWLDRMPGSSIPVIRQPFQPGDALPMWVNGGAAVGRHHLYDLGLDPDESRNLVGDGNEARMLDLLRGALAELEAPTEQWERLGL
jgi:arylsulfatase A-like enzyme